MSADIEMDDEFPLFVIVDKDLEKKLGMPGGVPRLNGPGMKPLLTVFTDEDLAKRLCEDLRSPTLHPRAIQTPQEMLEIAEAFQKAGIEDVSRDISFHPPTNQTTSIESFIASLHRAIRRMLSFPIFLLVRNSKEFMLIKANNEAPPSLLL